jgi:hypothetical protein
MTIPDIRDLSARLADLLRRERGAMADFLVSLADFDRQRGWREMGYASLFDYLHRELGLAKGTAFYRKTAAELIQRFPEVIEPLRAGKLCITSIVELARVMTPENRAEVLPRFFHCSKQEAQAVSAKLAPRAEAPLREVVTSVRSSSPPAAAPVPPIAPGSPAPVQPLNQIVPKALDLTGETSLLPRHATSEPMTADLSRLHLTVSRALLAKLEHARLALSHSHPGASLADVVEAGVDLVLARDAKKKALVAKPRAAKAANEAVVQSDAHVPAAVRREVWKRDSGCCQWPLASGGICGSRLRVELDHVVLRAYGGASTVDNLRVLCRAHNDLAARIALGDAYMDGFTRRRPAPPAGTLSTATPRASTCSQADSCRVERIGSSSEARA